jgi:hypothetical protein
VWLEGKKVRGGYALTRIGKGKSERWLLVKMDDEGADRRRSWSPSQPESVLSGKTIEEVAKKRDRTPRRRPAQCATAVDGADAGRADRRAACERAVDLRAQLR